MKSTFPRARVGACSAVRSGAALVMAGGLLLLALGAHRFEGKASGGRSAAPISAKGAVAISKAEPAMQVRPMEAYGGQVSMASTVTFGSSTATTNNSGSPTITIPPIVTSALPGSAWISYTEGGVRGSFLYVSNFYSNNVSAYRINASTGALTPVAGSPFRAGTGPASRQVSADGKFLFVANNGSNDVSAYRINSTTGTLSPVPGSPFAAGAGPYFITIEPSGQYVYVVNSLGNDHLRLQH